MIDEVLSVGDAYFRGKAQIAMKERVTSEQTVVFVSHMADQVKAMCDRTVWLDEGRVAMEGPSEEVVDAYQALISQGQKEGIRDQKDSQEDKRGRPKSQCNSSS